MARAHYDINSGSKKERRVRVRLGRAMLNDYDAANMAGIVISEFLT